MSSERTITSAQRTQLDADITRGDRVQFYLHLYDYTGSKAALFMSQISSASGLPGGVAYSVNRVIQTLFPADYPVGGIIEFSVAIAEADNKLIGPILNNIIGDRPRFLIKSGYVSILRMAGHYSRLHRLQMG